MNWSDDATKRGEEILAAHSDDLWEESERIAKRAEAGGVGPQYVDAAALHLRLKPAGQGWPDVLLGSGGILLGYGGGVLAALGGGGSPPALTLWSAGVAALMGMGFFVGGAIMKVLRR